jgi:pimeloyl-ACP methyl ester carboxylesterase
LSVETLRIASLGLPLTCHVAGRADAPPVVLLHGFLDTATAFEPVAAALAPHYRVLALDQRGFGQSAHLGPGGYYHFPDYLLDLDALFRAEIPDGAVVVGHSMGATVACYFAGAFPERVRAMVLLDGIGPPAGPPVERAPDVMRGFIEDVRRFEQHTDAGAPDLDAMARRIGRLSTRAEPQRLSALARAAAVEGPDGRYRWRFDPLHRTRGPIPFDPQRFRAFLARITCPSLLIWAEDSPMHPADEAERCAALRDLTVTTLPGVGHNMHHERPEAVAAAVHDFLEGLERR